VGSLEVGKLADLLVLDANPLTNIRNSNTIRYVMKNGRLYDANTLDENRDGSSLDDLRKQKECVQVTDDVTILKGILYSR